MSEPANDVSEALVASWRERLARLQASIDTEPQGEWAWLWKIRVEILQYLLSRHAEGRPFDAAELCALNAPAPSVLPESPQPYNVEQLPERPADPPITLAPQDLGTLRERLRSIRAANEERNNLAEINREAAVEAQQHLRRLLEQQHNIRLRLLFESVKSQVRENPLMARRAKGFSMLPPDEQAFLLTYANEIEAHLTAMGNAAEKRPSLTDDEIADILSGKKA